MDSISFVTLNNGVKMPQLGLGVYQVEDGDEVISSIKTAIESGYRLIDTAALYGNEQGVGEAIRQSGIPREELFITTKLWNDDQPHDRVKPAFDRSLELLGLDYVDLYLIHWPMPARGLYVEAWQALEEIYTSGRAKAIGVCNFNIEHLEKLLASATIVPTVNQVECHPYLQQRELRQYCQEKGIQLEAWRPLGGPKGDLMTNSVISAIADKHERTTAQVLLRWSIQVGNVVIPKSVHPERIKQNAAVFDFELDSDDMAKIGELDSGLRYGPDPAELNT